METSNFEMWVLHSITLVHSAEFTLVELLKTAKKHEIHVNNIQREREREVLHRKNPFVSPLRTNRLVLLRPGTHYSHVT
jgi:hypothetical protein